jgi:hypothetical protein
MQEAASKFRLLRGLRVEVAGSALWLIEEASGLATGRVKGALLFLDVAMMDRAGPPATCSCSNSWVFRPYGGGKIVPTTLILATLKKGPVTDQIGVK